MIIPGIKGHSETVVSENNTALAAGSGTLRVFATPFMIALMENAAYESIAPFLDESQSSVGTLMNVSHSAATPIGMMVWADSEVIAADGKKIVFRVTAYDKSGLIGSGTHERYIISTERFLEKCRARTTNNR
ncbi:MAG: thioesterase family protein [Clostridiales bacterium]|jgi:predicted thioesterase|nr:thioesterase family protein [Clostridiales bacterium]